MMKTKKIFTVLLMFTLITGILAGCGNKNKLADAFDEETVKEQAMADITMAESDDYEGWVSRFAPEVQSAVTEASYTSYLDILNKNGAFKEFGKIAVIGQEQGGKNYAVAVVICKHAKGDIKYTIAYDENMNLIQFTI